MKWAEQFAIIDKIIKKIIAAQGGKHTVRSAADFLGIPEHQYRAWKKQVPVTKDMRMLAQKLEISPVWLLLGVGEPYEGYDKTSPEYAYICDTLKEILPQVGQDSEVAQVGNITPHELRCIKDCIQLPSALTLARWVTAYRLNANFLLAHIGQPFLTSDQYEETFAHVENIRMIRDLDLKQELAKDLGLCASTTAEDNETLKDALREITNLTKENRTLREQLETSHTGNVPFKPVENAHL